MYECPECEELVKIIGYYKGEYLVRCSNQTCKRFNWIWAVKPSDF